MPLAKTTQRILQTACIGAFVSLSGCASIISGRHADVTFYSNVPNACVVIHDKHGKEVATTTTPSTIALKRKDRIIFPAKYTATIAAPGYQPVQVPIDSTVNPWVAGNVVFAYAGLVGLAVDSATGAAWKPKESTIYQELTPMLTAESSKPAPTSTPASYLAENTPPAAQLQPEPQVSAQPEQTSPILLPALPAAAPGESGSQHGGAISMGLY